LSYKHTDRPVATGIQKGLHQIGRRLGQLRALRVFRDDTDLTVSPDLWGKITEAMDRARYLVVVLSPASAASKWVNKEVSYWLQNRDRDRLLLVLADGHLVWNESLASFDAQISDAAPPVLTEPGSLPSEPFFVDVSGDAPWTLRSAPFREKVTALAAPIHGKPKDQLASDDLREQRRFRRLRAGAIAMLAVLTVVAVIAAFIAVGQRQAAIHQRDHAIALRLTAEALAMLENSISGNDVQAFQQLLAARMIAEKPDDGALYTAVAKRANLLKIIDTGTTPYGGALSPDGRRVVTGSADKTTRIWDITTGRPVGQPLVGHDDLIAAVAMSPDGRRIATGSVDKTIRLWDGETGAPVGQPGRGHEAIVQSVAFSPDGRIVASGSDDQTIRLWDANTGLQVGKPLSGHTREIRSVAFSPDGRRLASAAMDGEIRLWDPSTGEPIGKPLTGHTLALLGLAWRQPPPRVRQL
jgi:hypothetical protein